MTTKQKMIFDIINNSKEHLTAEQIFFEAKEKMDKKISMATVYNSLNYLCNENYIRKLKIRDYADCYDGINYPHEHLICDKCGEVTDFNFEELNSLISEKLGKIILSSELSVHHICEKCNK